MAAGHNVSPCVTDEDRWPDGWNETRPTRERPVTPAYRVSDLVCPSDLVTAVQVKYQMNP